VSPHDSVSRCRPTICTTGAMMYPSLMPAKLEGVAAHSSACARTMRPLRPCDCARTGNYPALPRSGLTAPRLVNTGLSGFCVGTCTAWHSGSGLRRQPPFTGGSECPTPTSWTLGPTRQCALRVAVEHPQMRGEHRLTRFDRGVLNAVENVQATRPGAVSLPCTRLRHSLRKRA